MNAEPREDCIRSFIKSHGAISLVVDTKKFTGHNKGKRQLDEHSSYAINYKQ